MFALVLAVSILDVLEVIALGALGFLIVAIVCVAVLAFLQLILPKTDTGAEAVASQREADDRLDTEGDA